MKFGENSPEFAGTWTEELDEVTLANRRKEVEIMKKDFDAYEVVPICKAKGKTFLSTRFVDTEDKSRFVSREFNGRDGSVEFFAPAATNSTAKFIDFIAAKRGHARMIGDFSRAFFANRRR